MPASTARTGFGILFAYGDDNVTAGVQSFKTWGSVNTSIRIKVKQAGAAGNGRSITVVSSGASFITTTLTQTAISITIPTTATVAQVIAYLYTNANFVTYWDADYNAVGDGSGTCPAQTLTTTAGGSDGAEVFTTIAEVIGLPGVGASQRHAEVTNMGSPNGWAEHIGLGLKDGKPISLPLNFVADNAAQKLLFQTRVGDGIKHNYKITFTDATGTTLTFGAIVTETDINHDLSSQAQITVTFLPTGAHTWAP